MRSQRDPCLLTWQPPSTNKPRRQTAMFALDCSLGSEGSYQVKIRNNAVCIRGPWLLAPLFSVTVLFFKTIDHGAYLRRVTQEILPPGGHFMTALREEQHARVSTAHSILVGVALQKSYIPSWMFKTRSLGVCFLEIKPNDIDPQYHCIVIELFISNVWDILGLRCRRCLYPQQDGGRSRNMVASNLLPCKGRSLAQRGLKTMSHDPFLANDPSLVN